MSIKRGQIYYIERGYTTGSEQWAGRPGIIVSNDRSNKHNRTVEVVYMTTAPKADLPTHVTILSTGRESVALCEQISTVSIERLGDYIGEVTDDEMASLETAMLISLDIQMITMNLETPKPMSPSPTADLRRALEEEKAKTSALRWAYESLLNRVLGKEEPGC